MRRLLTLFACLLMAGMALADKVSEREALKKAQAFMPGERFKLQKYSSSAGGQTVENPFYIFNVENGGGYVIVSGNDQTTAILGYSTNGNIDMNNIPDNLRYWLESYAEQLKAIDNGTQAAPAPSRARTRGERTNIEPLIQTLWNQDEPYNLMCPDGSGKDYNADGYNPNNRCVTGCVATAVAQVMYYHQWPEQTTGIASYTPTTINVTLEALPATTLEWSKMKLTYDSNETGDAADAVAKLMRYVGQAMIMNYNIASRGGSGTNIYEDAMINVFNYSKKIHTRNRDYYTTKQWEDMVYDELAHGRPVPYGGFSSSVGHQFVCDGYKDGLFSLNWGWGGRLNGYFVLSLADPNGQQGIGGSNGGYKNDQDAVFYFMPAEENEEEVPILKSADGINNTQTSNYTRSDASEDFSNVEIPCCFESCYSYRPTGTYDAEVGWGLYQDEELIQSISSASQTIDMRNIHFPKVQYQTYSSNVIANPFGSGLSDGKYQLRQIWRKAGSNDAWTLMDNYGTNYLVAKINGTSLTIRVKDSSISLFRVNSISVPEGMIEGEPVTVTVNITNEGETQQETVCLWLQEVGTSDWTKVASATGYVGPDETDDVNLTFTPEEGGSYHLKVTSSTSDEALATKDITILDVFQTTDEGIKYSCISGLNTATVINGDYESLTNVVIPATITVDNVEYAVKAVGERAFYYCKPESVILPEGLESIGAMAFKGCSRLLKLELPSTLSSIGLSVIDGCDALTTVISRIQDPIQIDENTFTTYRYNSSTQQYENIPSPAKLYVPIGTMSKYQAISGWTMFKTFEEGEEKEATVNGLNYLYYTGTKRAIVIAGDYSNLTDVEIPATITVGNDEYTVKAIGAEAFGQCSNLQSISLPDELEVIGDGAFNRNYRMGDIEFPKKLKSIGYQAFYNCSHITNVILPEGFETIGASAFESSALTRLELPSTLSSIGQYAFWRCNMTAVVSHIQEPFQIDDNTFATSKYDSNVQQYVHAPSSATLYVPKGTLSKYQMISGWTMFKAIEEGEEKETVVNGLNYSCITESKEAIVIAGNYRQLKSVEIPATITLDNIEYTVKAIGDKVFKECYDLKSISLPDGLETIGASAFAYCYRLEEVILPEGLKSIGDEAFISAGFKRIELPSTLISIGEKAFCGNGSLEKVISNIMNPFDINDNTFTDSDSPSPATLYVPIGTLSMYQAITGWTMFQAIEEGEADKTKEITLNGLKYLYNIVSKKATVIAGDYSNLKSAEIPATITIGNVEYTVNAIADEAFRGCKNLLSISLPEGLETIGKSAFLGCNRLSDYTIPNSLKSIGDLAFYQCYSLTSAILPEGLETIGSSAFSYCYALENLELPSSLKSIGGNAFFKASNLNEVISYIPIPFDISDETFYSNYSTPSNATLHVPAGTIDAYKAITGWTMFQNIVEGVEKEATVNGLNYSYSTGSKKATVIAGNYDNLWSAEIPSTITVDNVEYTVNAIAANAFSYCHLYMISLPDGLETIGDNAFRGNRMEDIVIPSQLKSIGEGAFQDCERLKNVILPEGLETLGASAFSYCFGLQKLMLPSSMISIGEGAFSFVGSLKEVISYIQNPFIINDNTFMYLDELSTATLYVPKGTKSTYEAISGWTMFQGGIVEMEPGDADGNGEITKADVMSILSYLLGDAPEDFDEIAADLNHDGEVTISDALILMGMISQD